MAGNEGFWLDELTYQRIDDPCTCTHPVDQHHLDDDGDPPILQLAPCHAKGCGCDDWDSPEPFPGRPPIWTAVVGLDEDGRVTVTGEPATPRGAA